MISFLTEVTELVTAGIILVAASGQIKKNLVSCKQLISTQLTIEGNQWLERNSVPFSFGRIRTEVV